MADDIICRNLLNETLIHGDDMQKLDTVSFYFPMPVAVVGTAVDGKDNFFSAAWVTQVNTRPPMFGFAANRNHYSCLGIEQNRTFSLCLPGRELVKKVDHVGIVSGREVDKSGVFKSFKGEMKGAPMIDGGAVCMECKLTETVVLPTHTFFIGSVQSLWCDPSFLDEANRPSLDKLQPLILQMPQNKYKLLGEDIAGAWDPQNRNLQD